MSINTGFGSDNHSGVHPAVMNAMQKANSGYAVAYGLDKYTQHAVAKCKKVFGKDSEIFFLYNGTASNILGLKSITDSFHAIICAESAHLYVHECCGPEKFIGGKLVIVPTADGKLTVNKIKPYLVGIGDIHMAQPKVISITQATERGTVYGPKEVKRLADFAHDHGMLLHMDGARLCNAAAFLGCGLREISGDVGVDVLSFGGTKNGLMYGEAVVFFNKKYARFFEFIRKQGMQLASKMRYCAAQFDAFFTNDLWLKNAAHANEMAQLLYNELKDIPGVRITQKVEANAVFAIIPKMYHKALLQKYFFHVLDERTSEVRLMCSFSTQKKDVLQLAATLRKIIGK